MDDLAVVRTVRPDSEIGFVQDIRIDIGKMDVLAEMAARVRDWPLMLRAAEQKLADIEELLGWWGKNVPRKGRRKGSTDRVLLSQEEAENVCGYNHVQIVRWHKARQAREKFLSQIIQAACRKAGVEPPENHRAEGTGDNEWYTPARYVEIARSVMGGIDLDPASNDVAQGWIKAKKYFTVKDNGLMREWHGRVWLNPPYAQPLIGHFIDKMVAERGAGRVDQAIVLTHNYTDTAWFHTALGGADMVCLTRGRIKFVDADGGECAPTQGQAFFYYGSHLEAFATAFAPIGAVLAKSC
jgi:phage N-6-adenine-methyltransferase